VLHGRIRTGSCAAGDGPQRRSPIVGPRVAQSIIGESADLGAARSRGRRACSPASFTPPERRSPGGGGVGDRRSPPSSVDVSGNGRAALRRFVRPGPPPSLVVTEDSTRTGQCDVHVNQLVNLLCRSDPRPFSTHLCVLRRLPETKRSMTCGADLQRERARSRAVVTRVRAGQTAGIRHDRDIHREIVGEITYENEPQRSWRAANWPTATGSSRANVAITHRPPGLGLELPVDTDAYNNSVAGSYSPTRFGCLSGATR